ncbi:MAG: efflux RND transporter periplasmic adaptor subunit [Gammaproteobacteria bacterium]|nr:MAG: efflux RND transporter periplasmic adaptor subunit [Gammaproteobacteria bacterium]
MNGRWNRLLTLAVVAGALAIAGWWLSRPEPVAATLVTVAYGPVESLVANTRGGTVNACRRARLAPALGGTIEVLAVREGDVVKPGQLLLGLWNRDLVAQVTLAESEARAAQSNTTQACLRAEVGRREADRLVKLRERNLIAEEHTDQAVTEAAVREAACTAARAQAEVARSRITVARAVLERSEIRAPFAGIVAEVTGELGEFVTPSPPGIPTPPAVDLVESGCLYVSAPIDEVDAPQVRRGMPARVTLDAFRDRHFTGRVRRVAPYVRELEKQARTVEIEVELDPGELGGLLPGYTADVEVLLESREKALRVPAGAVADGDRVLRYRPVDGVLEEVKLRIGLRNWQFVEVLDGLADGDRLALPDEGVAVGVVVIPRDPGPGR